MSILDEFIFISVMPGQFISGSDKGNRDACVRMDATLSRGFKLLRGLITQKQWTLVMGNNPWTNEIIKTSRVKTTIGDNIPATWINWFQANEFCRRLSELSGRTIRLPTEVEWEYCCRAGTTSTYFWGEDTSTEALKFCYFNKSVMDSYMVPVCERLPNPWGFHDMLGLAWEWVAGLYPLADDAPYIRPGVYPTSSVDFSPNFSDGNMALIRGGCASSRSLTIACANKVCRDPNSCFIDIGFRILLEAE